MPIDCEQRMEAFYYDTKDFFAEVPGSGILKLPFYHPFYIMTILSFMSDIVLVPIFYVKIYKFRESQNKKELGLTISSIKRRRHRNVVSFKFNLFTWIWETISMVIAALGAENQLYYLLSISCGPPLLYFIGIEENRQAAATYIASNIRIFKDISKKRKNTIEDDSCE